MSRPSPLSFARKKAWQRKRTVAPLRCRGLIDAFEKSFAKPLWSNTRVNVSFARKKALQRKRTVAPLRCRGLIDAFEKSLAKPKWSNIRWVFLFDALSGMFNARVRGGCRRARSPHANVLCEHFHASKADATNVARMSGGRAISRERPERVPKALAPGAQAQ